MVAAESVGGFDVVAASDLERARHTAEIIADGNGVGPVLVDPDLRERHAGAWEGLTKPEIEREYPGFLDDGRRPDGYEDDESVSARAVGALARIAAITGDGEALVVVHAGVIYAVEGLAGVPFERIPNLGGRWIDLSPSGIVAGERVLLIDTAKVEATQPDQL
jgi:broad specificity phosphatase PhoE